MTTKILLAVSLALAGCGAEECPTVEGACVEGYRGDPDALAAELHRCEREIYARTTVPRMLDGAWVRFVPDADGFCHTGKVAGCWERQWDLAYVEPGEPRLTALCHEAKHRAQFLIDRTIDTQHTDPRWWGDPPETPDD